MYEENQWSTYYSKICLIRHLKGIRKKWRIMQTGKLLS